jgi:glycosyltransferase involved in cell wall biosynthesis
MEVGGTQRQIVELTKTLSGLPYELSVAYFRNDSHLVNELRSAGIPVHDLGKRHRLDLPFLLRFCALIKRNNFDIIHAYSFSGELWSWLANAICGQASFVSSIRGVYHWYRPWQWWIKRWISRHSSAVVANSQAGAEYAAQKMELRSTVIDVVYNSIHINKHTNEKTLSGQERKPRNDGRRTILYVGRLDREKNLPCLLRAVRRLVRKLPQVRLELVGDGPDRKAIEKTVFRLGLGGFVRFEGIQEDVSGFYTAADVLVLPSFSEGFSNSLVEAMHAGCAVIASNTGGNSELIEHGRTGLLFPSDDDEVLAQMLHELLQDEKRRQRMIDAARVSVQPYLDSSRVRHAMNDIYGRCLTRHTQYLAER